MPKPLVAIIDDDPSVLKSLGRLLRSAGYSVLAFGSVPEFLLTLPGQASQCLLVDVQMPGMSGFELESHLRRLNVQIPIVFITAHDTPQTRESARRCGALGLFFKPFENDALLSTIGRAVTSREAPSA